MVYLVQYKDLGKVPAKIKIMCLEPRDDEKFEAFPLLTLSPFVKALVRQRRTKQAVTELSRYARSSEVNKDILKKLKKKDEDIVLVSWECMSSPTTKLRGDLLEKWKVPYSIIA